MSYRKRTRGSRVFNERMAQAREARERLRLAGPALDYPPELPLIRRRVIVEDYDFGRVVRHEIVMGRSDRIDCYDVSVDGVPLGRMGWSRVVERVRKAFVRVAVS